MSPKNKMLLIIGLIMIPSLLILEKYNLYNPLNIGLIAGAAVLVAWFLTQQG